MGGPPAITAAWRTARAKQSALPTLTLVAPCASSPRRTSFNPEPAATATDSTGTVNSVAAGSGLTPRATPVAPWRPVNWASTPSGFGFSDCRVANNSGVALNTWLFYSIIDRAPQHASFPRGRLNDSGGGTSGPSSRPPNPPPPSLFSVPPQKLLVSLRKSLVFPTSRALPFCWRPESVARLHFGACCPWVNLAREAPTLSLATHRDGLQPSGVDPVGEIPFLPETPLGSCRLVLPFPSPFPERNHGRA